MRLLVIGANGLLGSNVVHEGRQRGWDVRGTFHSTRPGFDVPLTPFDLRNYSTFDDVLAEHNPDIVVNCAAKTDVDACEKNPEQANLLNGEAPGGLAAHCERQGIKFIHVSTDYIFDGTARVPYSESDDPDPVQVYGESKLAAERSVRDVSTTALNPRLSFVWGIHRASGDLTGFPEWVLGQLQSGENVPLFTDQWVTPTRAGQAAETLLDLVERDATGIFHVASTSCLTPHEFGALLAEPAGANTDLLSEGSMEDVDRAATRPGFTCLDVEKVESALGRSQPTLREDVDAVWDAVS